MDPETPVNSPAPEDAAAAQPQAVATPGAALFRDRFESLLPTIQRE